MLPDVLAGVRAAGRPDDVLRMTSSGEFVAACGRWFDLLTGDQLRHLGQDELDVAVGAATRKATGDAWRWARRSTDVDISPLCAVSLAAWAVDALPDPTTGDPAPEPFVVIG